MANGVPMTTGIKQDKTNSRVLPSNLNQELCDLYLRCPECHFEKSLNYKEDKIICDNCGFEAMSKYGIPCLIKREKMGIHSDRFLGFINNQIKSKNPNKKRKIGLLRRFLGQEIIHFCNMLFFYTNLVLEKS
jgi:hypothetical protein